MTIDGYSQPGSAMNTNTPEQGGFNANLQIEVVGPANAYFLYLGTTNGINVTVQGLVIRGFSIPVVGVGGNGGTSQWNVFGNYFGTTADGTAVAVGTGNATHLIACLQSPIQIGGPSAWQRNLISGAGGSAVAVGGPAIIEGNLIGTDASGTQPIPNGAFTNNAAIWISNYRAPIRIGGAQSESRNLISGSHTYAVSVGKPIQTNYASLEIKGNYIGTDWTGQHAIPNGGANPNFAQFGGGILIANNGNDPIPAVIGGFSDGEANVIAYNRGSAISVYGNSVGENFDTRANILHHNHGVGFANIDIGTPGKTANDNGDPDLGANGVQNWPEILSASQSGNELTVTYRVDTAIANASYPLRIDFYANVQGGSGLWLSQDSYPESSAQQPQTITLMLPIGAKAIPFVAIVTDAGGHSSEFSPAFDVIFEHDFE